MAIFLLTTTTQTTAQATGGGGVKGSRGRGSQGSHRDQQDLIFFPTARATFTGIIEKVNCHFLYLTNIETKDEVEVSN